MQEINISTLVNYIPQAMIVVGMLTGVTNLVVQMVKGVTYEKIPTNIVALISAMVVTVLATFVYVSMSGIAISAMLVIGTLFLGLFVAYAAMFGFDKFKDTIYQMTKIAEK